LHQFIGWLGRRRKKHAERVAMNQYRNGQVIKYYILIAMLAAASGGLLAEVLRWPREKPAAGLVVLAATLILTLWFATRKMLSGWKQTAEWFAGLICLGTALGFLVRPDAIVVSSLQTGLLDPIPLIHRSMNLVILTAFDGLATASRFYLAAWSIAAVFFAALLLNLWIPRFYCRFICPLGALFGVLTRWTPWRIGRRQGECLGCELCENNCEGACDPFGKIHSHECLLCMNCLRACRQAQIAYGPNRSAAGEVPSPGITRRGFLTAAVSGLAAVPAVRLAGLTNQNWNSGVVRPPGALAEEDFLERCIKCGQCMRVCPTNVIQPATLEAGLEGLWTPLLNFRVGTSGCQLNCIACGNVCPTSAIRPLSLDEKLGRDKFADRGPVRMGTAFVDQGRCLPWAMNKPCIVCQENCPVSPKAIYIREEFQVVRDGARTITAVTADGLTLDGAALPSGTLGTGDYFVRLDNASGERHLITENSGQDVKLSGQWTAAPAAGDKIFIEVRLQKPCVDPALCIGCGICEHECPVSGLRAIRISAENESRNKRHSLMARA
jgi:ferredoxin